MESIKKSELDNAAAKKSGSYKVHAILLLSTSFSRETHVELANDNVTNEISIESEAHETSGDNKIGVTLTLDYKGKQNELTVCTAIIKMIGLFEKVGEPALGEDAFKKINAPAIIYPFVREHLHSICLKAGISNILLPTVNFKV